MGLEIDMLLENADIGAIARGRLSANLMLLEPASELVSEDIEELRAAPRATTETPTVAKLRATHHRLAQLLSSGMMNDIEVSRQTGYSQSRISTLKKDPAFANLLAHYQSKQEEVYIDFVARAAGVSVQALELLQERMDENPEGIKTSEITEILKVTADRSGNAPVTKSISATHAQHTHTHRLEDIKALVNQNQAGQVRRITHDLTPKSLPDNSEAHSRPALPSPTPLHEEAATYGEQAAGSGLREESLEEAERVD